MENLSHWLDIEPAHFKIISNLNQIEENHGTAVLLYDQAVDSTQVTLPQLPIPIILLIDDHEPSTLECFLENPHINHFIGKDEESIKLLLCSLKRDSFEPLNFGIESCFPSDAISTLTLKRYSEKSRCFDLIEQTIARSRHFQSLKDYAFNVASELLMNAFFDAPVDPETHQPMFQNTPRSVNVEVPFGRQNSFACALSPQWFAMAVTDSFGTLAREALSKSLKRAANGVGASQFREANRENRGAGVGFYMLYNALCIINVNVFPNNQTSITCFFRITRSQKEFQNRPKSIQFLRGPLK